MPTEKISVKDEQRNQNPKLTTNKRARSTGKFLKIHNKKREKLLWKSEESIPSTETVQL